MLYKSFHAFMSQYTNTVYSIDSKDSVKDPKIQIQQTDYVMHSMI